MSVFGLSVFFFLLFFFKVSINKLRNGAWAREKLDQSGLLCGALQQTLQKPGIFYLVPGPLRDA